MENNIKQGDYVAISGSSPKCLHKVISLTDKFATLDNGSVYHICDLINGTTPVTQTHVCDHPDGKVCKNNYNENCLCSSGCYFEPLFDTDFKTFLINILKGHENEKFFDTFLGDIYLTCVDDETNKIDFHNSDDEDCRSIVLDDEPLIAPTGTMSLYPSEELFRQYPLDGKTAWITWFNSQNKIWQATKGGFYYCIDETLHVKRMVELNTLENVMHYINKNYFRTIESAEEVILSFRNVLKNHFSNKRNTKNIN